ncbi:MAG: hypothetical protein HYX50_02945 [Chloroflexi bacterium]|nr:hypothetical protein [Chloroflexota bacterium]
MSHQLERFTDRKKIRGFARSVASYKHEYRRILKLWQCAVCRCYWEYIRDETAADGSGEQHRWTFEMLVERQEGGCL